MKAALTERFEQVASYIHSKMPHWKDGSSGDLHAWLHWYFCNSLLSALFDPAFSSVKSVVVARYLSEPQQYQNRYFHRAGGRICFVELAVAEERAALWASIDSVLAKHGVPELVMFQRGARSDQPRLYQWGKFARLLKKQHVLT